MLEDVVFISMEGKKDFHIGDFLVDEDISLPVFIEGKKKISIEDITPENIMTGMIKVLTDDPDNENIDYYRRFIFSVQPDIEARLTSVAYEAERNLHYDNALELYKVLYSLKPDSIDHNLNIAICYDEYSQYLYSQGIDTEAEKLENQSFQFFKAVDEHDDKNDRAYYYLGRFFLARDNFEKAIDNFKEFLKTTTDIERKKEVGTLLNEIINEGVTDEDYQNAVWLIQSDKEIEALKHIEKFGSKYPESWNTFFVRGWALRKLEKYTEAISEFEKALKHNPDSPDIYNELGVCYMNLKVYDKSQLNFYRALKKNPEDTSIMHNLALCNFKKGDKEEALKYCRVILEFNPDDLEIKKLIKIIEES